MVSQSMAKKPTLKKVQSQEIKEDRYGIAGLILGVLSVLYSWFPFIGLGIGIAGLIFSIKQEKIRSTSVTTGGKITSIIGLVLSSFMTIFVIVFFIEVLVRLD